MTAGDMLALINTHLWAEWRTWEHQPELADRIAAIEGLRTRLLREWGEKS